jgi:hypothetical protein
VALCTVDYVKAHIKYCTLTDEDILDTIESVSEDILEECGTTVETNYDVILAGKYAIRAAVIAKMKTTGELAATVNTGNAQRQNTADQDIERLEKKSSDHIAKYVSVMSSTYSSPSYHTGFESHHCGGHRGLN